MDRREVKVVESTGFSGFENVRNEGKEKSR